ncbi:basic proline-rich protein-like [Iris pallida]|uniref:Basic proline-rich protein-like n=1 Tax=Iris pallida TaxID=29817 RepID=A0AAX6E7B2_IRIPA|nr:basic proline-rich protein-like [Iris pallida]
MRRCTERPRWWLSDVELSVERLAARSSAGDARRHHGDSGGFCFGGRVQIRGRRCEAVGIEADGDDDGDGLSRVCGARSTALAEPESNKEAR